MSGTAVPDWFVSLTALGRAAASEKNSRVGDSYPVTVLSVPTGQFVVWALTNGAFAAAPKVEPPAAFPSLCVGWNKDTKQVDDVEVDSVTYNGQPALVVEGWKYTNSIPLVQLPEAVAQRTGKVLKKNEASSIKSEFGKLGISTGSRPWYLPWTEQCLSPIVVVGDGQEYLLNQLTELREDSRAESWLSPLSMTLSSVGSGKVTDPEHILRLPFSVMSQSATRNNPWINQLKPRLVIYTRWSYFSRRPPTAFSGVPTIVITNRRVEASVTSAYETQNLHKRFPDWLGQVSFPRGISCRYLEYPTLAFREVDDEGHFEEDDF